MKKKIVSVLISVLFFLFLSTNDQPLSAQTTSTDCGTDLSCFIQSSTTCSLASVTWTPPAIEVFGSNVTSTSYLAIQGLQQNKCIFYLKRIKTDLIPPATFSMDQQYAARATAREADGFDGSCQFDTSDLTNMLTRWQQGQFSSGDVSCTTNADGQTQCTTTGGDFGNAMCSGNYFTNPLPSITPYPGATTLSFTTNFHGIGESGDNANPANSTSSNKSPQVQRRNLYISIENAQGQLVDFEGTQVSYNSTAGNFSGTAILRTPPPTGYYYLLVKSETHLERLLTPVLITNGANTPIPPITFVAGDINGDNTINLLDYNILLSCFSGESATCTLDQFVASDLNDDTSVDITDLNLFIRELSVSNGE